jgi:hypothetical protein
MVIAPMAPKPEKSLVSNPTIFPRPFKKPEPKPVMESFPSIYFEEQAFKREWENSPLLSFSKRRRIRPAGRFVSNLFIIPERRAP